MRTPRLPAHILSLILLPLSAHAVCTTPAGNAGDVIYNATYNVMQYCNGTDWVRTGAAIQSAAGTACTNPTEPEGAVIYNAALGVVQFCNGDDWVNTACTATRSPGGPGCTTPTGKAGDIVYESTSNETQFCDSTNWVAMGWPCASIPVLNNPVSCLAILQGGANTGNGLYTIHPAGTSSPAFQAYCDMTTDGGGWTLVLNYLHQVGTNPSNVALANALPLQGGTTLGGNESGTPNWGHTAPSLLNQLSFSTLRFNCKTSVHARVMHFKTSHAATISYFKSGSGGTTGMQVSFTALAGHNANLPASSGGGFNNYGNAAMTDFPFYTAGTYHWGPASSNSRWECDDYSGNTGNTHHQIWVR